MARKDLLIALFIIMLPFGTAAQERDMHFSKLTIEDGLSQSTVQAIVQDSIGYMWFGTQDGLNRYDGYNFKVFRHSPTDPHSIGDNDIQVLYEDEQNRMWIGTQSRGLNRYDRETGRFLRYLSVPDDDHTLTSNTIWALLEDHKGLFWVGTAHGLNMMDRETDRFSRILAERGDPTGLSNNQVNVLYEDHSGTLWVGTENGVNRLNREDFTFQWYMYKSGDYSSSGSHNIRAIHEDQYGNIWLGTEDRDLFFYNQQNDRFVKFPREEFYPRTLSYNSITDIMQDSDGNFWVGTGNGGLEMYNPLQDSVKSYYQIPDDPKSLSSDFINTLYESREGILWIGTFGGGVNFTEPYPEKFEHFQREAGKSHSLSNNTVRSFHQDRKGNIWVGTDGGGLNLFDPKTGAFEHYRHRPGSEHSISNDVILDIHETDHGLWLATYGSGVELFDPESKRSITNLRDNPEDPLSLSSDYVFKIYETRNGKLWFGTNWGGINIYDPENETIRKYIGDINFPDNPETIGNNDIRSIQEDQYGDIWIGAYGEVLNRYHPDEDRFSLYKIDIDEEFLASVVQVIYEDGAGRLWMATRGGGLMKYNYESDDFTVYTTRDGLPSNFVHAIEEDQNGYLWLSTNDGISRFHPDEEVFLNYKIQDGLQSREFSPAASMTDSDGFIYFGGVNGFNRFHPEYVREDSLVPAVVLTELLLYNKPVEPGEDSYLEKSMDLTKQLTLDHNQSVITFGFTSLNYRARKSGEFAYKLKGFEEEWNYVGDQRRAIYTNLDPGEYLFRVKASNNNGIWDESGRSLALTITPPFWRTGWFYLLVTIFLAGFVCGIIQLRVRTIRRNNIRLEKLVSKRTEELKVSNATKDKLFSIIAHDLKNVASGLVGISDLLQNSVSKDDMEETKEFVGYLNQASNQFVSMLNNLLHWARSQTGKIEFTPQKVDLANISNEVLRQERMSAYNKGVTLESEVEPDTIVFGDPDMITIILRNLVNNALKFTKKGGRVTVTATINDHAIQVMVADTGIGMNQETINKIFSVGKQVTTLGTSDEKGTGIGISLCKDFVQKNGGKLSVESEPGSGTTISFSLPRAFQKSNEWKEDVIDDNSGEVLV